ncbi:MAG: archaeosortase/exosortase family protein, partial [Acidobacteria bacterium]|nr:archaeosortase/exosortase family protein [Acidobacteriota bacterium]
ASATKKLEVVEACSGIRSLMTLVTLAAVYAYFTYPKGADSENSGGQRERTGRLRRFGFWRSGILIASAIPIAITTNALRVSGTGVLARYYGTGVADGFFHTFSGWVIYIAASLLLFATGWLLDRAVRFGKGDHGGAGGLSRGAPATVGDGATPAGNEGILAPAKPAQESN